MLRLSNGSRMLIPKEILGELKNGTAEQAQNLHLAMQDLVVWWTQLDDGGLYLPDFLEHRRGKELQKPPRKRRETYNAARLIKNTRCL